VGALIFRGPGKRGPILLVERAGNPLKGFWSLPGGLVETGERLEDAIRREVFEETGLRVRPMELFGVYERIIQSKRGRTEYHYILFDYVCKVEHGTLQAGDDVSRVEWVSRSKLGDYRITEGTLEVIQKAYSGALRKRS
jgi:ADP-ribose pyrophosphatase YjhB (NUDIX family)